MTGVGALAVLMVEDEATAKLVIVVVEITSTSSCTDFRKSRTRNQNSTRQYRLHIYTMVYQPMHTTN